MACDPTPKVILLRKDGAHILVVIESQKRSKSGCGG